MIDNRKVIVGCTHGEEDPDRVAVAYLTAVAALELSGYAQRIRVDKDPPVERLHRQFTERGGRMYACPICFNERQLDQAELVHCAELKGATKLLEFAGNGAMTFTY
jgi:predicted peroxiredoxin